MLISLKVVVAIEKIGSLGRVENLVNTEDKF
jgi:hypothetical protein